MQKKSGLSISEKPPLQINEVRHLILAKPMVKHPRTLHRLKKFIIF